MLVNQSKINDIFWKFQQLNETVVQESLQRERYHLSIVMNLVIVDLLHLVTHFKVHQSVKRRDTIYN